MMIRSLTLVSTLFAATLVAQGDTPRAAPAQDTAAAAQAENMFYRAFFLDRGERRPKEALELYTKFLEVAPAHRYAGRAAQGGLTILNNEGRMEEAEKFKAKFASQLRNVSTGDARPEARPDARPEGAPAAANAARLKELKDQLEKAKEEGDEQATRRLERQIRMLESGQGGRGMGGEGRPGAEGRPGGGRAGAGGILGGKKLTEMNDEELASFKTGLANTGRMAERMRENGMAEQADRLEGSIKKVKDLLEAGKKEEAQKALEEMRAGMGGGRAGRGGGR